ncbi:MAG: hypothetical protein AABY22_01445 [Nanoarchaeota archaeon]
MKIPSFKKRKKIFTNILKNKKKSKVINIDLDTRSLINLLLDTDNKKSYMYCGFKGGLIKISCNNKQFVKDFFNIFRLKK